MSWAQRAEGYRRAQPASESSVAFYLTALRITLYDRQPRPEVVISV